MSNNDSLKYLIRLLDERYDCFFRSLTKLKKTITLDNIDQKITDASETVMHLESLEISLAAADRPAWMAELKNSLNDYKNNARSNKNLGSVLLDKLLALWPSICKKGWNLSESNPDIGVDFNKICQDFYRNSKVPELFNNLISQLEKLIQSGLIDSIRVTDTLQQIISTIKKNKDKDFFSNTCSKKYISRLLKNLFRNYLVKNKMIGPAIEAIQQTMDELDLEYIDVAKQVRIKINSLLEESASLMTGYNPLLLLESEDN